MEIERKFLVDSLPHFVSHCKFTKIEQSYLSKTPQIRIRREDDSFILTHKGEGTLCRSEDEEQITEHEYNSYLASAITHPICKIRYFVPLQDGNIAQVDKFDGYLRGLITVEVEFSSIEDSEIFIPPSWFGREVTEDENYKNKNLARLK